MISLRRFVRLKQGFSRPVISGHSAGSFLRKTAPWPCSEFPRLAKSRRRIRHSRDTGAAHRPNGPQPADPLAHGNSTRDALEPPAGDVPAVARALTIEEGDLIAGARGSATDVCLATGAVIGAFVSLDLYLVRPDRAKVSPRYLAAFLELPATQAVFAGGKQGSALARLPKDALEKTPIPVPPMQSQLLIAGLARSFEEERKLLQRLSGLKSFFGRETVAHAIRAAEAQPNSQRSPE